MMKFVIAVIIFSVLIGACVTGNREHGRKYEFVIETSDVHRFYELYDAESGTPDAPALQTYIDEGSEGLRTLSTKRNVTGERIAEAIQARPDIYEHARECVAVLPAATKRLKVALKKLYELYPAASTPSVTIAVGRGRPVGIGYPDTGVQIGLEALCSATFLNPDIEDRLVYVIAHEYVHVQQSMPLDEQVGDKTPSVLEMSLIEGIAEFIGELISGDIAYGSLVGDVAGRELEIEQAFLADKDNQDLSDWMYNSKPDKPGDLGYWVGYRIAKAYFQNADDKNRAIADMLEFRNSNVFLEASGWYPGIQLKK